MKRVIGLGGIFFKCDNPKKLQTWYQEHLGIPVGKDGAAVFEWREKEKPGSLAHTVWGLFAKNNEDFRPSRKQFMLNYRVADLEGLLRQLKKEGVEIAGEVEEHSYGKFGWILDPEGNKIELWEPNDLVFRKANGMEK